MSDLTNLVWHRMWLSMVTGVKYSARELVDKFYGIYTEQQITQEMAKYGR